MATHRTFKERVRSMNWFETMRLWTNLAPLFAAILAPLSTLLDIPALTENWFAFPDGSPIKDKTASTVLSAISLSFNVTANALLFTRFTLHNSWWIVVTRASIGCWFVKIIVAAINFAHFGLLPGRTTADTFQEGFWCAAMSLLIALVIFFLLLAHWLFHAFDTVTAGARAPTRSQLEMRIVGRTFMFQNTLFVAGMGILALFMSRLEHWTYFQGVYFAVITFLTIGFGDFVPTTPATKAVLLPFALFGIAQLGHLISMMASFLNSRTSSKHAQKRAEWEKARQDEENKARNTPNLSQEMSFLQSLHRKEDMRDGLESLALNLVAVSGFWLIGALIFSHIEGWSYGNSLYFCYIFFLTIGYGDYAPNSAVARVVFIIYALLTVPIMTSFAVQTITSIIVKLTDLSVENQYAEMGLSPDLRHLDRATTIDRDDVQAQLNGYSIAEIGEMKKKKEMPRPNTEAEAEEMEEEEAEDESLNRIFTHAEFVNQHHQRLRKRAKTVRRKSSSINSGRNSRTQPSVKMGNSRSPSTNRDSSPRQSRRSQDRRDQREELNLEEEERAVTTALTEHLLEMAIELERQARRLLIAHMDPRSKAQILLKADRYVQLRETYALAQEVKKNADEAAHEEKQGKNPVDATVTATDANGHKETNGVLDENDPQVHDATDAARDTGNSVSHELMRKFLKMEWEATEGVPVEMDEMETLLAIRKYRHAFAGMLACGSRLMKLNGEERYLFERRKKREEDEESVLDFDFGEERGDPLAEEEGEGSTPVEE